MKCSECGRGFMPHRDKPYGKDAETCGDPECQRARKTRLQRDRRLKQRRSTLPQCADRGREATFIPEDQRRYTVIRSRRSANKSTIFFEAEGLELSAARAMQKRLEAAEQALKPNETSWTRDVIYLQLERPIDEILNRRKEVA